MVSEGMRQNIAPTEYEFRYLGVNKKEINEFVEQQRPDLKRKGISFKGPYAPPETILKHIPTDADENLPEWLVHGYTPDDIQLLQSVAQSRNDPKVRIFIRGIILEDENTVRKLANETLPQTVRLRITTGKARFHKLSWNVPHTYDPSRDYKTDLDYEV